MCTEKLSVKEEVLLGCLLSQHPGKESEVLEGLEFIKKRLLPKDKISIEKDGVNLERTD